MVQYILTERYHANKEDDKVSIYDLINNENLNDEELENLDPKKVRYD